MLEAFSHEFSSGAPWDDLYADDLVIIAELLEECVRRLLTWKEKNGEERAESKCRKYKNHDLRYRPGPPAEFRRVPMRCLSHYVQWAATASSSFCVLGDMLSAPGDCKLLTTKPVKTAWKKFKELMEEVQGADTTSLFLPPLFQDMYNSCAERNAPCQ